MALLFIDSFDHYTSDEIPAKWQSVGPGPGVIRIGEGRCGTNCMFLSNKAVVRGLPFASLRGTVGFAIKAFQSGINVLFFGDDDAQSHLILRWYVDGSLGVERGSGSAPLAQSAPGLLNIDTWYYLELQALIDPTAGEVIGRINNTVVFSASGLNTVGPILTTQLRTIIFNSGTSTYLLDDVCVLDSTGPAPWNTFLGDCRVEYLRPRAAGSSQQWTPVGTPLHWSAVDDNATPDGDVTHITSNTPGHIDTHLYTLTGLPSGPLYGAQLSILAKKSDVGSKTIAPVANGIVGAAVAPSYDAYRYFTVPYPINPATGLAWTIAEINAAQFGVKVEA